MEVTRKYTSNGITSVCASFLCDFESAHSLYYEYDDDDDELEQ
jgi:hypothetical protein